MRNEAYATLASAFVLVVAFVVGAALINAEPVTPGLNALVLLSLTALQLSAYDASGPRRPALSRCRRNADSGPSS